MPRSEFAPIVDSLVDGLAVIDHEGTIVRVNPALCEMFGYAPEELIGQNVAMLMPVDEAERHDQYLENYLATGEGRVIGVGREVTGMHRDGSALDLELSVTPASLNEQQMFVGFLRDITERKEAETRFYLNNKIMRSVNRALANVINEGMSTREVFDGALEDLLDVTESEYGFIGEILHDDDDLPYLKTHAITNIAWNKDTRDFYRDNFRKGLVFKNLNTLFGVTIRTGQLVIANEPHEDPRRGGLPKDHPALRKYLGVPIYTGPKLLGMAGVANRADGYDEDLVDQIKPLVSALGTLIATHQNNQSRIKAEEELFRTQQQLKQMATMDPTTGIANRYMLVQELEVAFSRYRGQEGLALLFIDVDRFKSVNDEYGHDAGDRVLQHVAKHLTDSVRPTDIVGRYGGDEFIACLPGYTGENALAIAERIREGLAEFQCVLDDEQKLALSMSVGVAILDQGTASLAELIRLADQAVYQAKNDGRNCVRLYEG